MAAAWWSPHADGITVTVRVTPGARRSELVECSAARLRVRIAAPAVEGKANAELQRFLAERFGVRRSAVVVLRGDRTPVVQVNFSGCLSLRACKLMNPHDEARVEGPGPRYLLDDD